jgi:hypothetical protein
MHKAGRDKTEGLMLARQAIVAALPALLYGLCVAAIAVLLLSIGGPSQIVNLGRGPVWHYGALVVGLVALVALVAAAAGALLGYLPAWSYPWLGALIMGALIALNLVVEDRAYVLAPAIDVSLLALLALSILITFGAAALRGWPHSGLYTMGACGALGLSLLFFGVAGPFQAYLGGLAALVGAAEALSIYVYARGSSAARVVCLAGVAVVNVAIAWLVEDAFRAAHPDRGVGPFWSLAALLTALLIGGTLAGSLASRIRRSLRRP